MSKTIRLLMPQWQGGNNPAYHFGAQLLAWLAPRTDSPEFVVPVTPPSHTPLSNERGIVGRGQVVEQLHAARKIIAENQPDKMVILGGDCLVDLAPFSYLSEKYGDSFGILWLDAHPDVMTPEQFSHSHSHVLGALMGNGDADLTDVVTHPVPAEKIMIAGLNEPNDYEKEFIKNNRINICSAEEIKSGSDEIINWIKTNRISHLAIHFDLDVLNYHHFRSLLFANPDIDESIYDGIGKGSIEIPEAINIINKVNDYTQIVGLGIAEHLPWDAINMKQMLASLPLLND